MSESKGKELPSFSAILSKILPERILSLIFLEIVRYLKKYKYLMKTKRIYAMTKNPIKLKNLMSILYSLRERNKLDY